MPEKKVKYWINDIPDLASYHNQPPHNSDLTPSASKGLKNGRRATIAGHCCASLSLLLVLLPLSLGINLKSYGALAFACLFGFAAFVLYARGYDRKTKIGRKATPEDAVKVFYGEALRDYEHTGWRRDIDWALVAAQLSTSIEFSCLCSIWRDAKVVLYSDLELVSRYRRETENKALGPGRYFTFQVGQIKVEYVQPTVARIEIHIEGVAWERPFYTGLGRVAGSQEFAFQNAAIRRENGWYLISPSPGKFESRKE